ncbi:cell division protein FtsN [Haemophilus haemolyticus]|uniref:Cell division protein FtsN n=1 Tax=Haemophilus haemolyticus TaxID=726 RepID=A0A502LXD2_HAEHA|nr:MULTISPECIES: cell division protein FtsN [Haemophilus]UJZ90598.1 cell division protein FtsN [Haemophilus seminalis]RDE68719.1 cell division protein FtsN [Haemophilus haemolyticus]TPH05354.1 cell division protein FtsN [Haemophilus haemolyticus]TPH23547.1 cell division protein FtsN [Haemophilus haemolyticus]TPH25939.1 cell division protein FtsN [Haemophilus haemolyticus]
MAHRDFVARRGVNKKKGKNKNILIGMMIAVVFAFGIGLYFLKNKTEEKVVKEIIPQTEKTQPKSILPNRPEEVWSYIKALETRTVPVDDKPSSVEKNMRLTEEQRQVLIQMEKDQKAAEEARKLAEQQAAQESTKVDNLSKSTVVQQSSPVKTEQVKKVETVKIDTLSIEAEKKAKQAKLDTAKKVESIKTVEPVKTTENENGSKKFGLQCGAFKNRAQAESLQGRLAMTGFNAQVQVNGEWNRVRIGNFANRDAAMQAQSKAKGVADCVVIGM